MWIWSPVSIVLGLLSLAAIAYLILAIRQVGKWDDLFRAPASTGDFPAISVMRPLCGAEPRLYDTLKCFFQQDYPQFQLVFGVRDRNDPALQVVSRLRSEFPDQDVEVIVDARIHGANLKVSNLMNMISACRHPILAIADSDVWAAPDTLQRMGGRIAAPEVGAVTALYCGKPMDNIVSQLGALYINGWFLPSALVDLSMNGADGCFGAMTVLRRSALDDIGGLDALTNYLAEDNRMGRMMRDKGWTLKLEYRPVVTMVNSTSIRSLARQEVRWSRTVRSCRVWDHALSLVLFPLPVLLILLALEPTVAGAVLVVAQVVGRIYLHKRVNAKAQLSQSPPFWMIPLREIMCFLVWIVTLRGDTVLWRGTLFKLQSDGSVSPVDHAPPTVAVAPYLVMENDG